MVCRVRLSSKQRIWIEEWNLAFDLISFTFYKNKLFFNFSCQSMSINDIDNRLLAFLVCFWRKIFWFVVFYMIHLWYKSVSINILRLVTVNGFVQPNFCNRKMKNRMPFLPQLAYCISSLLWTSQQTLLSGLTRNAPSDLV